jgi:RNA polymerase sigma-70 factor (ECF subfamily)
VNEETIIKTIEAAKKGDQLAFSTLLDTYWSDVFNFQNKMIQNDNDAEDICIETFSKAFDKIDTYNPDYNFKTWLIAISKNIHIDLLRKRKNAPTNISNSVEEQISQTLVDEAPTAEDELIKEQQLHHLLQHINNLKPDYGELIKLRYFQQMRYAMIAEQLNQPLNSIKVKLLRAKKLLAKSIQLENKSINA